VSDGTGDRRLIEDYLPVQAINAVAQREKIGHAALHPRKLHLWWARRPLAAARAAVYATLVPAQDAPDNEREAAFFTALCRWGASDRTLAEARERIMEANGGVPPKVLDMFAGGGAIPLEALRLGCEATAVELNPVAHLIERCMLEYPQRFGPSLADDIRKYGQCWVERTWARVGHLYPRVREAEEDQQISMEAVDEARHRAVGRPIAYLWTRTVPCPNPSRAPHVAPLVRQTWLAKKKGRYVALCPVVDREALTVGWEVVEAADEADLGFDPAAFSKRGATTCLGCGAAVDDKHVKAEGIAGRMGIMPLAAVLVKPSGRGRDYMAAGTYTEPDDAECSAVLDELDVHPPDEPIPVGDARNFWTPLYGLARFRDLFTPRQLATLCAFAQSAREGHAEMISEGIGPERAEAVATYFALTVDRVADRSSTLCRWENVGQKTQNVFGRQALPMVWDFAETNPFAVASGSVREYMENVAGIVEQLASSGTPAAVHRTSATQLPDPDNTYDAIITDPPYYDNISYADLSDFFYVWLKRSLAGIAPDEAIGGELTPKRREAIVAPYRFDGDKAEARRFYENEMAAAFAEAHRVLKPGAPLVCVYAHKTTLGWATLVEALRRAGFMITEAWPLDTEMPERSIGQGTASLASSIFLVARKREDAGVGDSAAVHRELDKVIAERLERLIEAGVSGSDLVVATIGAGLAPFTRYASVELPNGEPVLAEGFLGTVQSKVLGAILAKVHGLGSEVGGLDAATRYYVLARYSYGYNDVDFDEANNLARSAGIELNDGISHGRTPLAKITKKSVHLCDFDERGADAELGLDGGRVIDVLQGVLWRANHASRAELNEYLLQTQPDRQCLRLVTQALQGPALRGQGETKAPEAQACERLLGSWRTVVEDNLFSASG
jgi:putative DNA methylase